MRPRLPPNSNRFKAYLEVTFAVCKMCENSLDTSHLGMRDIFSASCTLCLSLCRLCIRRVWTRLNCRQFTCELFTQHMPLEHDLCLLVWLLNNCIIFVYVYRPHGTGVQGTRRRNGCSSRPLPWPLWSSHCWLFFSQTGGLEIRRSMSFTCSRTRRVLLIIHSY